MDRYVFNNFRPQYFPKDYDTLHHDLTVDDQEIRLALWRYNCVEESPRMRRLGYSDVDVFLVCFSLMNPSSLALAEDQLVPQLREFRPETPFILVGLQSDLRKKSNEYCEQAEWQAGGQRPRSRAVPSGEEVAKRLGAQAYIECSALLNKHVNHVFKVAVKVALRARCAGSA
jgi:GTPase SAR1 family protein